MSGNKSKIGSQYDNCAWQFIFMRPERYAEDDLILLFNDGGRDFTPVNIGKQNIFPISNALTQTRFLRMQAAFEREGEKLVHSNINTFDLRPSLSGGISPVEPWPDPLTELASGAFFKAVYEAGILSYYNHFGELVWQIDISALNDGKVEASDIAAAIGEYDKGVSQSLEDLHGEMVAGHTILQTSLYGIVPNRALETAQVITTDIVNLQSAIDSLPKYLNRDVTINVTSGTYNGNITIERFAGPGELQIIGANELGTTHNISRILIKGCAIPYINIRGFNVTAHSEALSITGAEATIYVTRNAAAQIHFSRCRATEGLNTAVGNVGFFCESSRVFLRGCEVSNKYRAVLTSDIATACILDLSGQNNNVAYSATNGSTIQKLSAGTISSKTQHVISGGSMIINSSGSVVGT